MEKTMSKHMPPIPPKSVSPKGPGGQDHVDLHGEHGGKGHPGEGRNLAQQGRQGNSKQNTTHQGYQQDR
jgi:hypothetical protein